MKKKKEQDEVEMESNQIFRILGVDNPEELAKDKNEWRGLCGEK